MLIIRITRLLILCSNIINSFVIYKVAELFSFVFIRIEVYPCEPSSSLGHISNDYEIVAIDCGILNPKLEAQVLEFEKVVHLYLAEPFVV